MSKVDEVMILARNYNGCIPMDDDGNVVYVVKPVDDENYDDIPDKLAEQLKQEGKYGWYASICVNRNFISAKNLPIYGRTDRYETKWFYSDLRDCIQRDLRDRSMGLYDRIMKYEENRNMLR